MNLYKNAVAFALMCLMVMLGSVSVAQNLNTSNLSHSPYNRYGYGRMGSLGNAVTHSMGDVGVAIRSNTYTNVANPASLTAIDTLTMIFSVGLDGQYATFRENDITEHSTDAGFSYMSFHFPLWRNFAMSLSLSPYSMVGYYYGGKQKQPIDSSVNKNDTLTLSSAYSGVGGINNMMMGIGWRLMHTKMNEASFGMNFGFLFGSIEHDAMLTTSQQATGTYVSHQMDAKGFMLGMGLQYTHRMNATKAFTLGATFQPQMNLSVDTHEMKYSTDTVQVNDHFRSDIKQPMKVGVGFSYEIYRKLTLSAEYELTQWSKVKGFNADMLSEEGLFDDVHRLSIGAEYLPKVASRNYLQTCRYRVGFSTRNNYIRVKEASLREYMLNAGMSLPVNRRSAIDLGIGYTLLQPSEGSMVKENYLTFTLGVTFNEMMFFRNKLR